MLFRILKNDLRHKRGINIILFIFMVLATVFVASSVNNILVVSNATKYCMDKGKVADEFISSYGEEDSQKIETWLQASSYVKDYSRNEAIILGNANIDSFAGKDGKDYGVNATIMLQPQWKDNMIIFDKSGNLVEMNDGEIGMAQDQLDANGLKIGDEITFKFNDTYKTFKITKVLMDPAFGGDYVGMTRYLISDHDYNEVKNTKMTINYCFNVNTDDKDGFYKAFTKQAFNIGVIIDRNMFESAYVVTMLEAGMLIIIGICLILIAFLILRFTIVFTLQEEYKEIGIMKAIGIKNYLIKRIYLIKYFILVAVAAVVGCIISVPISNGMLHSVGETILLEDATANFGINILCSIFVAVIVVLLCYFCANRLRKFSAIEAIRNGSNGERFKKKSKLALHKRSRMKTPFFLALNDICSNMKRYVVLLLTFIIGTIMIILPVNAITSFGSDEMAKNFMLDTDADFYLGSDVTDETQSDTIASLNLTAMKEKIERLESKFKDGGYDVDISTLGFYSLSYYGEDDSVTYQLLSSYPINSDLSFVQLVDGTEPKLENEIAMSENAMKDLGVKIGDTVHVKVNNKVKDFIITASYQNFMQMGKSAILSPNVTIEGISITGNWYYQCYLNNHKDDKNVIKDLQEKYKECKVYNTVEAMDVQLGSTVSKIGMIKMLIVILILAVNVLITALMMKIFIKSEKSQLALLRSIGYSKRALRLMQVYRIVIILVLAIVLGSILCMFLNDIALRPVFGLMGATHMKIAVNPLEVYLLYPVLLLVVIGIAAYISSGAVKKLNLMEINNQE